MQLILILLCHEAFYLACTLLENLTDDAIAQLYCMWLNFLPFPFILHVDRHQSNTAKSAKTLVTVYISSLESH